MRLNIQIENGQAIYKNRILTHNLMQFAQETNSLPIIAGLLQLSLVRSLTAISSNNPGNQAITPVTVSPKHPGLD